MAARKFEELEIIMEGAPAYDLEERTYRFARQVRDLAKKLPENIWNREYLKQVIRSSASVAANYIEVNDSVGEKDSVMKLRICKREAKETILWLRLIDAPESLRKNIDELISEASQLMNILAAIYHKRRLKI